MAFHFSKPSFLRLTEQHAKNFYKQYGPGKIKSLQSRDQKLN